MLREDHQRLMSEARATSNAARVGLCRALVTARQIEKLVRSTPAKYNAPSLQIITLQKID
jgi:hypothetical protein